MAKRTKGKKKERQVFDSIRKPTAPPSHKLGPEKAESVIHPSMRKAKHKVKPDTDRDEDQ